MPINRPKSWKLIRKDDEDGIFEEIVLRVQGILCGKSLPPIRKPVHM
jgi:hypothetical protein